MPIYEYKAFASGGKPKTGVVDADTERDARQKLRREQLLVTGLHELRGGRRRKVGKGGRRSKVPIKGVKIPRESLFSRLSHHRPQSGPTPRNTEIVASLTRQMATLLGSGIALTQTLTAIVEQAEQRKVETMFREIRERIQQGTDLADALSAHPDYFSELYVNMVRAGQATGNLDIVLSRIADYLAAQGALRRKIVSAMLYPVMMITIGIVVVSILMAKVVPEITSMLIDQGKKLPPSTQVLINISEIFKNYWWLGFLIIGAVAFIFERIYRANKRGRLVIDRSLMRVPVLGELLRKAAVGRFTRTLSTLLQSGVPVIQGLEITQSVVGNRVVADATGLIKDRVMEGTDITTPLRQSGAFPAVVGYMVAVGEQSGELEQMLDRIALAYDEEIDVVTERFTALLEPIMIVLLAGVVGYIVFAIVQPILEIGQL